jgi:hypothetical protein
MKSQVTEEKFVYVKIIINVEIRTVILRFFNVS